MYKGFNVNTNILLFLTEEMNNEILSYYEQGRILFEKQKKDTQNSLKSYLNSEGIIDGTALQNHWFPEVKADIFISHSHKDEKLAIRLAGWLHYHFGLISFIDSCLWGYSDNLLYDINKYNKVSENIYDYGKIMYASSHVNMMLAIALQNMMDKTECLFFINTDNSVYNITNEEKIKTLSPWIYYELAISKNLRINVPTRIIKSRRKTEYFSVLTKALNENQEFIYEQGVDHLKKIDTNDLLKWKSYTVFQHDNYLDVLYDHIIKE